MVLLWKEEELPRTWWEVLTFAPPTKEWVIRWEGVALICMTFLMLWLVITTFWIFQRRRSAGRAPVPYKVVQDPMAVHPESMIPGSPLMSNGRIPSCQIKLAVHHNDEYVVVGAGIRIENYLITPTHNVQTGGSLYMMAQGCEPYRIDTMEEQCLAADVSAFKVSEGVWARLRIQRAKLGVLSRGSTVCITSSCDNRYSMGIAKPSQWLGRLTYDASTVAGFSGGAYMSGNVCIGMHCHGGSLGGGYEALYLWARLKVTLREIPEDSEDFMLTTAKTHKWQCEEVAGDDQVIVRMETGAYHIATKDLVARMRQLDRRNWADDVEADQIQEQLRGRADYEPECVQPSTFQGEFHGPVVRAAPGAISRAHPVSQSIRELTPPPSTNPPKLMKDSDIALLLRSQAGLISSMNGTLRQIATSQQTLLQKQNGKASSSNSQKPTKEGKASTNPPQ